MCDSKVHLETETEEMTIKFYTNGMPTKKGYQ